MRIRWMPFLFGALNMLISAFGPASAQSSIPPLTSAQMNQRSKDNANETAVNAATSLPGAILEGGKILVQKFDPASLGPMTKAAERGSDVISYSLTGAKILSGTASDGWEGFKREGTQAVIEKGADIAGHAASSYMTSIAIGSGAAAGFATGAAGISYSLGSVIGKSLRDDDKLGHLLGYRGAIGDEIDTAWVKYTPDSWKELASGTKQIDIEDPAVLQQMRDTADRNIRKMTFDRIQGEHLEQQQMQNATAQMMGELAPSPPIPSPYAAVATSLQEILESSLSTQAQHSSLATPTGRSSCKLDVNTGCHPGHNEASHPGGCKIC